VAWLTPASWLTAAPAAAGGAAGVWPLTRTSRHPVAREKSMQYAETQALRAKRERRAQAHACVQCLEPWAVRGARHPSGAWIFVCRRCDWRRIVMPGTKPDPT